MSLTTMTSAVLGVSSIETPPSPMFNGKLIQPGFVQHAGYQAALDNAVSRNPRLAKHAFAIADLTDDPTKPKYAGHNDTMQVELASLSKLMVLYAAHQVRFDLGWWWSNRAALGISDLAGLAKKATEQYKRCGVPSGYPKVASMFVRAAPGDPIYTAAEIEFQQGLDPGPPQTALSRAFIKPFYLQDTAQARSLKAHEQLRLIGEWSDNFAPGRIASFLSYELIYELLRRSGLNRDNWTGVVAGRPHLNVPGGIYLGPAYGFHWLGTPKPKPPGTTRERTGTALSVATCMTALAQQRLIVPALGDQAAHSSLLELLRRGGADFPTDRTFIGEGIFGYTSDSGSWIPGTWKATSLVPPPNIPPRQPVWKYLPPIPAINVSDDIYASKIGLIDPDSWGDPNNAVTMTSDVLLLRCTRACAGVPKVVTVVLVGIADWYKAMDGDPQVLRDFGAEMANAIAAENNLDDKP